MTHSNLLENEGNTMGILPANPLDGVDEDTFEEEGDGTEYNFRELMDQIYHNPDCIITIPNEQINLLRQGLIVRKSKDNFKMKRAGITADTRVLSFLIYPAKEKDGTDSITNSDVRVKLAPKRSINIIEIRMPDDEI